MAGERTVEEIAQIFNDAGAKAVLLKTDSTKWIDETEEEWKERIKNKVDHLETIKEYKKLDGTTSIWTTENFTSIDSSIVLGKNLMLTIV